MLDAIANASWANIWAALSAISTSLTLVVAIIAMRVWKSQEKLKAKQAFKTAISEYIWCIVMMPKVLDSDAAKSSDTVPEQMIESVNRIYNCRHAWLASEGLLDKNVAVFESWEFIRKKHGDYINGKISNEELIEKGKVILAEKFVFK